MIEQESLTSHTQLNKFANFGIVVSAFSVGITAIATNGGFSQSIDPGSVLRSIILVIGRVIGATMSAVALLTILSLIFGAIPLFIFRKKKGANRVIIASLIIFFGILFTLLMIATYFASQLV